MSTLIERKLLASCSAMLLLLCGPVLAGDHKGAYVGGGLGGGNAKLSSFGSSFIDNPDRSIVIVEVHGGYRFNPYFSLEGQLLGAANGNDSGGKKISFAGISGRALVIAPVSDIVDLFALVGFYTGDSEVGFSDTETESGAVYGAGIQLNFGSRGQYGVRGGYELYKASKLLDQVSEFTISFQYNFF